MSGKYLGHLSDSDPLHHYLKHEIQPQLTGFFDHVKYRVFNLEGSNDVYLYEEKHSGARIVGKFFLSRRRQSREHAAKKLDREFGNLCMMRDHGFTTWPHYIARPLGRNDWLNHLMIVEYCHGEQLGSIISRAIGNRDDGLLFGKLTALAYFLSKFHNRTTNGYRVEFHESCSYMDSLTGSLLGTGMINQDEANELYWLRDRWREHGKMWEDVQVLTHGDATPANFLFGDGLSVISFDLERIRRADRVFDTGRIAGELMHYFLEATGNKYAAEPFIGHFLWEYSCHFPDREQTFRATSRRVPFYMGITLMRIARNNWLDWNYRKRLVHEGKECLRRWTI